MLLILYLYIYIYNFLKDGDGFITNYELQKLFDYDFMETKMCKIMTDEMIKDGDINKDSKVFSHYKIYI